jgi:hypothetical protein
MKLRDIVPLVCAVGFITSAMAQSTDPVSTVRNVHKSTATVESVDAKKRLIELRTESGTKTVAVPAEVRNLEQVRPGDQVVVEYYEGLAAQFKKKGESTTIGVVEQTTGTARQAEGMRPGGAVANTVTTTVVIESVNQPQNSVTFTGPAGMTRTVDVKDPKAQQFIGTLKKGDEVELTYTEALAVSVQPQKAQQ